MTIHTEDAPAAGGDDEQADDNTPSPQLCEQVNREQNSFTLHSSPIEDTVAQHPIRVMVSRQSIAILNNATKLGRTFLFAGNTVCVHGPSNRPAMEATISRETFPNIALDSRLLMKVLRTPQTVNIHRDRMTVMGPDEVTDIPFAKVESFTVPSLADIPSLRFTLRPDSAHKLVQATKLFGRCWIVVGDRMGIRIVVTQNGSKREKNIGGFQLTTDCPDLSVIDSADSMVLVDLEHDLDLFPGEYKVTVTANIAEFRSELVTYWVSVSRWCVESDIRARVDRLEEESDVTRHRMNELQALAAEHSDAEMEREAEQLEAEMDKQSVEHERLQYVRPLVQAVSVAPPQDSLFLGTAAG